LSTDAILSLGIQSVKIEQLTFVTFEDKVENTLYILYFPRLDSPILPLSRTFNFANTYLAHQ